MHHSRWKHFFMRTTLIIFWLSVFALFLYGSHIKNLFKRSRSINVFTWPMLLDPNMIQQFEKETGISVYLSYYENNDELFSKLRATQGEGYDIVIPSDYTAELLIKEDFLKKIDISRITNWYDFDEHLINLYYDPHNEYTVPFYWSVYGLAINTKLYNKARSEVSWDLVFNQQKSLKPVIMPDGVREVVLLAENYLFGTSGQQLSKEQMSAIKKLLIQQKEWVCAYTETNIEHLLLSKSSPIAVAMSAEVARIQQVDPSIDFVIPKNGAFMVVDSFAMPKKSLKDEYVYQFINFMLRSDVLQYHVQKYGMCSPLKKLQKDSQSDCRLDYDSNNIKFFKTNISEKLLNEIWIELMSH